MASLTKINLDGTDLVITDKTAQSVANSANTTAKTALTTANLAKTIATKKAYITYTESTSTITIVQGGE